MRAVTVSEADGVQVSAWGPGDFLYRWRRMEGSMMLTTMVIEPVRAFSGMDVLVACDEGLFTAEGLEVQIASREPGDLRSTADGTLAHPVSAQGRLQERGVARMYQA